MERSRVMRFHNEPRNLIVFRRNHWILQQIDEGQIRQRNLRGDAFPFGVRSDSRQLIAGLFFIGFRKQFRESRKPIIDFA